MKSIRIGAGAGFGGDRIEPAVELAAQGDLHYLVFECLAERTIALAQQARLQDPAGGYDQRLRERMTAVLPLCASRGIKIVSNMGAANPAGAAEATAEVARSLGIRHLKIAYVLGDDVIDIVQASNFPLIERKGTISEIAGSIVSANAYLGVEPMVDALRAGADIVITGRCGDPALFVAPLVHEFGWRLDDWDLLGRGTVTGHLLECTGQLTGGYFADPGYKDVGGLSRLGFPIAEVAEDGSVLLCKVAGSGGELSVRTCKEQLLYEVHDPAAYITPDAILDFTRVRFEQTGANRVRVSGARHVGRPERLKVVGFVAAPGAVADVEIAYAGSGAAERARRAADTLRERLRAWRAADLRIDLVGVNSVLGGSPVVSDAPELRVHVSARCADAEQAQDVEDEVYALTLSGPAGGGSVRSERRARVDVVSGLIARDRAAARVLWSEVN